MRNSLIFTACALSTLCLMPACTDVDLCNDAEHPHTTPVSFDYDWSQSVQKTDSMYVIAYRVIKNKLYSMAVNSDNHQGHFIFGAPAETEEPADPEEPTIPEEPAEPSVPAEPSEPSVSPEGISTLSANSSPAKALKSLRSFSLAKGEYKFFTFAFDNTELLYNNVTDFLDRKTENTKIGDIYLEYKTYKKGDPGLKTKVKNWDDYNPYAGYIQTNVSPVTFDSIPLRNIDGKAEHVAKFTPRDLTQNIDVYFDIKKDISNKTFVVDSVVAEISGIPTGISIGNGYIDITHTAKMLFYMDLENEQGEKVADSDTNTKLTAHGNINVTGIVKNALPTERTGPGIMQLVVYTHTFNDKGEKRSKRIQGKINIFNSLTEANLIEIVNMGKNARRTKEHGVLRVKTDLVIEGQQIADTPTDDNGIDQWVGMEDIFVDI